jgi:hypothetical protein
MTVRAKGVDCFLPLAVAVMVSVVVPAGDSEFTGGLGRVPSQEMRATESNIHPSSAKTRPGMRLGPGLVSSKRSTLKYCLPSMPKIVVQSIRKASRVEEQRPHKCSTR